MARPVTTRSTGTGRERGARLPAARQHARRRDVPPATPAAVLDPRAAHPRSLRLRALAGVRRGACGARGGGAHGGARLSPGWRAVVASPASSSRSAWCSARRCSCTSRTAPSRRTSTSSSSSGSSRSTRTGCRSSGTFSSSWCRTASAAASTPTSCTTTPRHRAGRGTGPPSTVSPCWRPASARSSSGRHGARAAAQHRLLVASIAAGRRRRRAAMSELLVNLARRNQSLLNRQLDLISDLEQRERQPDVLAELFQLDHLATRIRRNAESLLVLSGDEPARRWGRPVPLGEVVRAAAAEVEDYRRVDMLVNDHIEVAGRAVADLAHLLAELIENATSSRRRPAACWVRSHLAPRGRRAFVLTHRGPRHRHVRRRPGGGQRAAGPRARGRPAALDELGFHVVARLASRYGMPVNLASTPGGGLTALVRCRATWSASARPAGTAVRPSTALRRSTAARSRPSAPRRTSTRALTSAAPFRARPFVTESAFLAEPPVAAAGRPAPASPAPPPASSRSRPSPTPPRRPGRRRRMPAAPGPSASGLVAAGARRTTWPRRCGRRRRRPDAAAPAPRPPVPRAVRCRAAPPPRVTPSACGRGSPVPGQPACRSSRRGRRRPRGHARPITEEDRMTTLTSGNDGDLNWLMSSFTDRIPGAANVVVVSSDGWCWPSPSGLDRDPRRPAGRDHRRPRRASPRAPPAVLRGRARQPADRRDGRPATCSSPPSATARRFAVFAAPDCDIGLIGYEMSLLVDRMGKVLTPALRAELQAALPRSRVRHGRRLRRSAAGRRRAGLRPHRRAHAVDRARPAARDMVTHDRRRRRASSRPAVRARARSSLLCRRPQSVAEVAARLRVPARRRPGARVGPHAERPARRPPARRRAARPRHPREVAQWTPRPLRPARSRATGPTTSTAADPGQDRDRRRLRRRQDDVRRRRVGDHAAHHRGAR